MAENNNEPAVENGDNIEPEFRRVVDDLTIQALREYDDGPLTPQYNNQDHENVDQRHESNLNDADNDLTLDNNLIVLDPDHPLMDRFQKALKDQLLKREEKITLEARETKYQLDKTKREREELGVELYGLQQELAKNQMFLEKEFDKFNDTNQTRKVIEEELGQIRDDYRSNQKTIDDEMRKVRDLQQERDNLKLRIFYMNNAKEDIRSDIAVIRRATEKADTDKNKFEVEKQRQDMIVNRLEEKEARLKEDINLYEWQLNNQLKESKAARTALDEAKMESEAIEKEKNQLMQNWTSCLIGMKRRDEAYSQMNEAIRAQKQKFDSTMAEIDSYKKSINKEQETNESLTVMTNNRKSQIKFLEKAIKSNKDKLDLLQQEYSAYSRALKETENVLSGVNLERTQKLSIMAQYQREIETLSQEKVKIEDEIFKKLQDRLTADKAAQYSDKLRKEQKEKLREIERSLAKIENEISKAKLERLQTTSLNEALERDIGMLKKEIEDKNKIISKSETEINQRTLLISRKQDQIDMYNKKIEALIEKAGGVELGPLELEEKNLSKEIDQLLNKIMELEQKWLREQNELVRMVRDKQNRTNELKSLRDTYIVLTTKKMRIEKNIESEQNNIKTINKNLDHLRLQLEKLNRYIYKETDTKNNLEKNYELSCNEHIERLKLAEQETNNMQNKLEQIKQEKDSLLKELIETDDEIMTWEKRIQIAKEMKAAVDSETGQGEIKEMKFEIHRMKVRYADLMKQQEKLVRDMEAAVLRRDTILTRSDLVQKNPNAQTQGKIQKEIVEIQKKIKATNQEINQIETELRLLKDKQQQLASILEDKQNTLQNLQLQDEQKSSNLEELTRKKHEDLQELISKQDKLKYYEKINKKNITLLSEKKYEEDTVKQVDKLRSLGTIVSKLSEEYPNLQLIIRKVESSIQNRLNQEEEGLKL